MWPHPRVRNLAHASAILRGNPAGDPHERALAVYVPAQYESEPGRRFPVIFVLTGFSGSGAQLVNVNPLSPSLPERMDRMIADGRCPPVILAMPDCYTRYGGSQYLNSSATGRYQDYVADELVDLVDRELRTLAGREHRGVVGKSSGGYGALRFGIDRAEVFGAVGSHAGDCYFDLCYRLDFPGLVTGLAAHEGNAERFLAAFLAADPKPGPGFAAFNLIAMAAAYSPNPGKSPLPLDLPCDPLTGEIDEAVWRRWLEHDPVYLVGPRAVALRSLKLLFLDAGKRDEYHLHLGARILAQRLREHEIPHLHEEFEGGHRDSNHRYERSLPLIAVAIA